jgi:hypothetical protein
MGDVFDLDEEGWSEGRPILYSEPKESASREEGLESAADSGFMGSLGAHIMNSSVPKAIIRGLETIGSHGYIINPATGMPVQIEEVSNEGFSLADNLKEAVENGKIDEEDRRYFNDVENIYDFRETLDAVSREKYVKRTKEGESTIDSLVGVAIETAFDPIFWAANAVTGGIGGHVARFAAQGGLYGLAHGSVDYAISKTVPKKEILYETIGGAFFGALLGGIASPVARKTFKQWSGKLGEYLMDTYPYKVIEEKGNDLYVKYLNPVGKFVLEKVGDPIKKALYSTPYLQALRIQNQKVKNLALSMMRNNQFITDEVRAGKTLGLSAEAQKNIWLDDMLAHEINYNAILENSIEKERINPGEFNLQVDKLMRGIETEASPLAKKAADELIKFKESVDRHGARYGVIPNYTKSEGVRAVRGKIGKEAKEAVPVLSKEEAAMSLEELMNAQPESLNQSPITAKRHFPRTYNKEAIYANKKEFEDLLRKAIFRKNPNATKDELNAAVREQYGDITGTNFTDRYAIEGFAFDAKRGEISRRNAPSISRTRYWSRFL